VSLLSFSACKWNHLGSFEKGQISRYGVWTARVLGGVNMCVFPQHIRVHPEAQNMTLFGIRVCVDAPSERSRLEQLIKVGSKFNDSVLIGERT
jgi:hypothetical protein